MRKDNNTSVPGGAFAVVADVLDEHTVVINKGSADGIEINQRFLIYVTTNKAILDPETGENLGILEIARGTGKISHVQERIATLESDASRKRNMGILGWVADESIGFKFPEIGDKVRPV